MARVCVFDVNETLLDMGALDPHFERVFGDASARQAWFDKFLQLWLTETVTGVYQEFGTIGGAALKMLAESWGTELSGGEVGEILGGMKEMPPHPEVEEGLSRLRDAGFRLATLTNSTRQVGEAQIENSGLRDYFEQTLSADTAQRLPEPNIQGVTAYEGTWYLSRSRGSNENGYLIEASTSGEPAGVLSVTRTRWGGVGVEDLSYWPSQDTIWTVTEHPGKRAIYSCPADAPPDSAGRLCGDAG